jgi:hypothetical protein
VVELPLLHVVVELHAAAFVVKKRVRSCTRQLLHRWWRRHCCLEKPLAIALSLAPLTIQDHPK